MWEGGETRISTDVARFLAATVPRHLATGHGVDVFLALTCVLAKGQNVGVSIALDGLSDSNSRDWLFTFSGTGADRCLHAAKAVYIILR